MTDHPAIANAAGNRLRRDLVWNLVPVALLAVIGLGLNFAIGRHWGELALGDYNLVTTAMFAFAVVGAGGLQYAVLRAVAADPTNTDRVAAVVVGAVVPGLVLAAISTGAFVALRQPIGNLVHSNHVADGMLWAAPGLFCFAINKTLLGVVNGLRRMRAFAIYTSLRYLLIAIGLVVAWTWEVSPDHLPAIWSFTEGTLLLVLITELVTTVSLRRGAGWQTWAKAHLGYGARSVLASLALEVNSKLDLLMVAHAMPEARAQVGIYSLASVVYEGAMQLSVVVQNNLNPVIARRLAAGELREVETLVARSRRWFVPALVGACTLGAVLYPFVIPWLSGDRAFAAGALPFAILMGGIALSSPYLPFNQMLLMAARPGWHTIYVLATVAVAFVANYLLIPVLGLAGAGLGTATGLVGSAFLLRLTVRSRLSLRI